MRAEVTVLELLDLTPMAKTDKEEELLLRIGTWLDVAKRVFNKV